MKIIDSLFYKHFPPSKYADEVVKVRTRWGTDLVSVSRPIQPQGLDKMISFAAVRLNMSADVKPPCIRIISDDEGHRHVGSQFSGIYLTSVDEIWLAENTVERSSAAWRDSVIVHETVHYLQRILGTISEFNTNDEIIATEIEAYTIQRDWIRANYPGYEGWLTEMDDKTLAEHVRYSYGLRLAMACDPEPKPEPPFTPFDTEPRD